MEILITTTADEDAAILKVAEETPAEFVQRHVRRQLDFVLQQARPSLDETYARASVADKQVLDDIRERTRSR